MFKVRFAQLVNEKKISDNDADAFRDYVDLQGGASFTSYLYTNLGLLPQDHGYEAAARVMENLGLSRIEIDRKSAEPYEEQFWEQFDVVMELTEAGLARELPSFVTDPANQAKVEALISGRRGSAIDSESTQRLEASA